MFASWIGFGRRVRPSLHTKRHRRRREVSCNRQRPKLHQTSSLAFVSNQPQQCPTRSSPSRSSLINHGKESSTEQTGDTIVVFIVGCVIGFVIVVLVFRILHRRNRSVRKRWSRRNIGERQWKEGQFLFLYVVPIECPGSKGQQQQR